MSARTNNELIGIIASGTAAERAEAWEQLLEQIKQFRKRCLNACLCAIVATADDYYQQKAWNLLLEKNTFDIDFCQIIARSVRPNAYQKKAWDKLLKMEIEDSYPFRYIIDYAQEPFKSLALKEFIRHGYPRADLKNLLEGRSGKETDFWKKKIAYLL